ncbi:MAG: arylsulfatase [Aureispira sp.]
MKTWYDNDTTNGEIREDVRNSYSNWDDFSPKVAPDSAPNILFILYDDTGLGAWSPYGGSIQMPTMDSIAADGLIYTQWHTTALCSPTRSTIMTGRNHHLNGMASITETADGYPGANGRLPANCMPFAELLQNNGYSTYWLGKNHNVPETDIAPGGYRGSWPCQMGFDRFYGFLGGETNNWYPDLVSDNHFIEPPYTPKEGYHLSHDLTEQAIRMLRNQNASNPSKPWYMWFCPGANHAPHHAPDSFTQMYTKEQTFIAGYEVYRDTILKRMVDKGILPETTTVTALNFLPDTVVNPLDTITPWDSLDADSKELFVRMAEVYAGFSTYTDYKIGKLIEYLKESGQYENTIIIYAADNGASGEGTPAGSVNENKFFNGYPDELAENMKYLDTLGSTETYNHFPTGWAAAFSTPFKMFKRYSQFAGGTNDPLVISWPRVIKKRTGQNNIRHQYHHSVDIVPTLIDAINHVAPEEQKIKLPSIYKGVKQQPLSGTSMFYTFLDGCEPNTSTKKEVQYYCMLGTRGIWADGWKAVALHAPTSGKKHFDRDAWELYHVDEDRSEDNNLADSLPEKLDSLINLWYGEAAKNNVLPLDDRVASEILTIEHPGGEPPTDNWTYYPKTTAVPEGVAANIRGASYTIEALVNITPSSSGVIFAHGSRFGGHTLYIEGGELVYLYNFLGIDSKQYEVRTSLDSYTGNQTFTVNFDTTDTSDPTATVGTLTLSIGGTVLATLEGVETQTAKFTLSGDGLCVGYDSADPITNAYSSEKGEFDSSKGRIYKVNISARDRAPVNYVAAGKRMMLRQ